MTKNASRVSAWWLCGAGLGSRCLAVDPPWGLREALRRVTAVVGLVVGGETRARATANILMVLSFLIEKVDACLFV